MPPYILTINLQLETTGRQSSQHYYRKYTKNITMGNKEQVNQEGGTGTDQIQTRYRYGNYNTTDKSSFNSNITKVEDAIFTQGLPYDTTKYDESIKTLINYVQGEYSTGVYLRQAIREIKVPDLALPTKPTKEKNQSDAEFNMEVFEWKDNVKTVFVRRRNIEEGNKNIY